MLSRAMVLCELPQIASNRSRGWKKSKASFVRVTVQGYGCGIPPDVMQRMFAPFFTTKGKSGSGLGLPQVLAFMQSVEGRLEISSDTGIGTSIRLLFPVGDARLSY